MRIFIVQWVPQLTLHLTFQNILQYICKATNTLQSLSMWESVKPLLSSLLSAPRGAHLHAPCPKVEHAEYSSYVFEVSQRKPGTKCSQHVPNMMKFQVVGLLPAT